MTKYLKRGGSTLDSPLTSFIVEEFASNNSESYIFLLRARLEIVT
jgi:hypothetical protein